MERGVTRLEESQTNYVSIIALKGTETVMCQELITLHFLFSTYFLLNKGLRDSKSFEVVALVTEVWGNIGDCNVTEFDEFPD